MPLRTSCAIFKRRKRINPHLSSGQKILFWHLDNFWIPEELMTSTSLGVRLSLSIQMCFATHRCWITILGSWINHVFPVRAAAPCGAATVPCCLDRVDWPHAVPIRNRRNPSNVFKCHYHQSRERKINAWFFKLYQFDVDMKDSARIYCGDAVPSCKLTNSPLSLKPLEDTCQRGRPWGGHQRF